MFDIKGFAVTLQNFCLHEMIDNPKVAFATWPGVETVIDAKELRKAIEDTSLTHGLTIKPLVNVKDNGHSDIALVIERDPVVKIKNKAFKVGEFGKYVQYAATRKAKQALEVGGELCDPLFYLNELFAGRGDFDFTPAAYRSLVTFVELDWEPEATVFMTSNGDTYVVVTGGDIDDGDMHFNVELVKSQVKAPIPLRERVSSSKHDTNPDEDDEEDDLPAIKPVKPVRSSFDRVIEMYCLDCTLRGRVAALDGLKEFVDTHGFDYDVTFDEVQSMLRDDVPSLPNVSYRITDAGTMYGYLKTDDKAIRIESKVARAHHDELLFDVLSNYVKEKVLNVKTAKRTIRVNDLFKSPAQPVELDENSNKILETILTHWIENLPHMTIGGKTYEVDFNTSAKTGFTIHFNAVGAVKPTALKSSEDVSFDNPTLAMAKRDI